FRREAQNAAALSHPNIVSIFDQGQAEDGTYYIAMEYLPGGTLKDRLRKSGPLQNRRAAAVALQIARALRAAHDSGVVHGCLEPHNVLITESGNVKVKDFGIARTSSSATTTGSTPDRNHYLSSEQAAGEDPSPKSDLYSLGVILYEMLTGELPYDAETPTGIAMKHANGHPREPTEVDGSVPEGVNAVVMGLIARDPEDRYADAGALVEDLERVSAGLEPVNAGLRKGIEVAPHEASRPRRAARRQEGRRRNLLLIIPLLAVLILVGLAWAGLSLLQSPAQEPEPRPEPQPVMLRVPDLEGMTLEEARQQAGENFAIVEDGRENSSRPGNTILSQEPSGGEAERGSEIRAVLASGHNEVPVVENLPLEEARQALSDAGFETAVTEAESTAAQTGLIISQEPASGSTADVGSEVEVVVGTGPALVEVPNLYGYTLDEAAVALESLGLALGGSDTAPSDEVAEGGIIAQSVAPGTGVEAGTVVGVTLSSGPALVPVPNVVGQPLNRAQQTIVNVGLYYAVLEVPNAQWPAGTVLYTDPGTGTPLVPGSTVTIGYSSGPSSLQPDPSARTGREARQARNRPARSP
ncbi:MAG: PASTA domain-containing protein, partial [Actinomycetota bacterium]|nr:PASTA domain-containing protein [Actinomycetota bacterium]